MDSFIFPYFFFFFFVWMDGFALFPQMCSALSPQALAMGATEAKAWQCLSVVHACDPGYVLLGAVLNCAAGVWSAPAPRCEGVFVIVDMPWTQRDYRRC